MNSTTIPQQFVSANLAQASIISPSMNNLMVCPTLQSQQLPYQNQQQSSISNNVNQGFGLMQNFNQLPMMNQNSQPTLLCFPAYMGGNAYQGIPIYAVQNTQQLNQNGMMSMMYPLMPQQQQQQQQLIQSQNQLSTSQSLQHQQQQQQQFLTNFTINNPNTFLINQASQSNIISQNTEQQSIDSLRIPSLLHIGGLSMNNINNGNFIFQNQESSLLNCQQMNSNQVKIENNTNEIALKKSMNGSESSYFHLAQSGNEDNTSFKLVKNHSISTANMTNQSSGNSLTDNDYEDAYSNNNTHFQYKTNCILTSKIDQGETATAHSLSCPTDLLNTKQAFINIPFDSQTKKQKQSKQANKVKINQKDNIESCKQKQTSVTVKIQNKLHSLPQGENSTTMNKQSEKSSENHSTSIMNEEENISESQKHNEYLSGEQNDNMANEENMDDDNNSIDEEQIDSGRKYSKKGGKFAALKKSSKQEQTNQQNQQNKIIKEKLLENASSAEKELLNQIQQISKQNSAKAFLKAYKKFALQDHEYIYNYEISENQYYYKVCRDMPIIRIDNPNKKDLEGFYRKFKKFFNGKQYNNNTLKIVVRNKLYGKLFNDFLELHSEKWLEESKSKNKDDLRIIIKFLQMCHQNLNYLVFLRDHDKSKDKSHSGYESD